MKILDLSESRAGAFAAMLLAELGADVIKVEPPRTGDPLRAVRHDVPDDFGFEYLNRRKRGITLNVRTRQGRRLFLGLVGHADAVIESFQPDTSGRRLLSYRALRRANPRIVLTTITPFGLRGPRHNWQANELMLQAMGGVMEATGFDGEAPLKLAGSQAAHIAGLNAATATLAAIHGVNLGTERGVHIDVAIQETLPPHWARHISQYVYSGTGMRREGRNSGRQGFQHTAMSADGYLYLLALRAEWESFAYFLGLEQFVTHEWSDPNVRAARWAEIEPHFAASIASRSKYDWFAAGAEMGYTFAPVEDAFGVLASPQLAARGFFHTATIDDAEVPCPGLPFTHAAMPAGANRAPALGEHNAVVYGELLGLPADQIAELSAAGVL
jgi:crotonobetainyl-CoA:carnitine CoA-transferase CaiB-like acyl-CoA transferase